MMKIKLSLVIFWLVTKISGSSNNTTLFETACNAIAPPAYGIFDRGVCYVFEHKTDEFEWSESLSACNHMSQARSSSSRVNGGLAMWLPPTLLPRMKNDAKYDTIIQTDSWFLLGGATPALTRGAELSGLRYEVVVFSQDPNYVKTWSPKIVSRGLFENFGSGLVGNWPAITAHNCLHVNAFADMQLSMGSCVRNNSIDLSGYVCQYEPHRRSLTSLRGNFRLNDTHIVGLHVGQTFSDCMNRLVECRACHSLAYSKTTSTCQTYIGDDRLPGWSALLIEDVNFKLHVYV